MRQRKGLIQAKDLEGYRVFKREPLWSSYRGYRLATMPPPSSGVFLLSMLKMLEAFPCKISTKKKDQGITRRSSKPCARATKDRSLYGGDTRFIKMPIKRLLSPTALRIAPGSAFAREGQSAKTKTRKNSGSYETTHFSIMDYKGNALSSTQSINYRFGARVMIPKWELS